MLDILTKKISAIVEKNPYFSGKFQIVCPLLPLNSMSWNLVCGVFITNQTIFVVTDKFDVLRGRLLGNHNDFHSYDFRGHMIFVVTQGEPLQ